MTTPAADERSPGRRAHDRADRWGATLAFPPLPPNVAPSPVEAHLGRLQRHPLAVAGIVENGLVRPLDPGVKLAEHSRVIIVAAEAS